MKEELPVALERARRGEAAVVSVIVQKCDWNQSSLAALQVIPSGGRPVLDFGNRSQVWRTVLHQILEAAARLNVPGIPGDCIS